jgi:predicted nucleotidyltransferase
LDVSNHPTTQFDEPDLNPISATITDDMGVDKDYRIATAANLEEVIDSGLARVREKVRIEAAYLFGSQPTDHADQDSDIDLAIFSPDGRSVAGIRDVTLPLQYLYQGTPLGAFRRAVARARMSSKAFRP